MIVKPDFFDHWKTRRLIELTGDESAPLCIQRFWAHCQNSKRGTFPDLTQAQLASICHWEKRTPACHTALVKCGFVEKLKPRGFIAHDWAEENRQLIQKWEAGKNGGRPKNEEKTNESTQFEKPTDNRPITGRELDRTDGPDRTDLIEKKRSELMDGAGSSGSGSFSNAIGSSPSPGSVQDLTAGLARHVTAGCYPEGGEPSLADVQRCMENRVRGAGEYAEKWLKATKARGWKDHKGQPIMKWKPLAESFADGCVRQERGVSSKKFKSMQPVLRDATWDASKEPVGGNFRPKLESIL